MTEVKTNLTLKQRRRLQGAAQPDEKPKRVRDELSRALAILIFLLSFGVGTGLGMMYFKPDPRLQELDDIQAMMAEAGPFMPSDIRGQLQSDYENVNDTLPTGQRRMSREDRGYAWAAAFLAKSSADQLAELEARIAAEKRWQEERAQRELEAAANATDASQANNNASNNNNGGHHHGGRSDEQRTQNQENRDAMHPPDQRAEHGLMHQMMNAVRQQQGLAPR